MFSRYIRTRDNYTCFTCGKQSYGSGMHAGHWIPASVGGLALRYNEYNVNAQCFHCNINLGGYGSVYTIKMIEKYGQAIVDELFRIKREVKLRESEFDFEGKIAHYTAKLAELTD